MSTDSTAAGAKASTPALPQNGSEYLESLKDGRKIWIYGEQVTDVTTHPAFRNSARSMARLYDAMHDPVTGPKLMTETDTGSGRLTHRFFKVARSRQDLRDNAVAIQTWQDMVYGWMGRTPDYKAALMVTCGQQPEWFGEYEPNARAWYRKFQEEVPFFAHAIANPPVDRGQPVEASGDVFVHVIRETDAGLIVSGAKVVATGSPIAQYVLVGHQKAEVKDKAFGLMFIAKIGGQGVKLLARHSYEEDAARMSTPFDYPLASRLDENDAILIFDEALIPWEDVLIYDEQKISEFIRTGWTNRAIFQANIRLSTKLGFIAAIFRQATEIAGNVEAQHIQQAIGEILVQRNLIDALRHAMIEQAVETPFGSWEPSPIYSATSAAVGPQVQTRVRAIAEKYTSSALIYLNSSAKDFANPKVRDYLDRYLRGSNGKTAEDRSRVMKLLWDALGSEFAGRHDLYEQNYLAQPEVHYLTALRNADIFGTWEHLDGLVADATSNYDLHGWRASDLIPNADVADH